MSENSEQERQASLLSGKELYDRLAEKAETEFGLGDPDQSLRVRCNPADLGLSESERQELQRTVSSPLYRVIRAIRTLPPQPPTAQVDEILDTLRKLQTAATPDPKLASFVDRVSIQAAALKGTAVIEEPTATLSLAEQMQRTLDRIPGAVAGAIEGLGDLLTQDQPVKPEPIKPRDRDRERAESTPAYSLARAVSARHPNPEEIMEAAQTTLKQYEIAGSSPGGITEDRLVRGDAIIPGMIEEMRKELAGEIDPVKVAEKERLLAQMEEHMNNVRSRVTLLKVRQWWPKVGASAKFALQNADDLNNAALIYFYHHPVISTEMRDPKVCEFDLSAPELLVDLRTANLLRKILGMRSHDFNGPFKDYPVFNEQGKLEDVLLQDPSLSPDTAADFRAKGWTWVEGGVTHPAVVVSKTATAAAEGTLKDAPNAWRKFLMLVRETVITRPTTFDNAQRLFFERDSTGRIVQDKSRTFAIPTVLHVPTTAEFWLKHFHMAGTEENPDNWYELLRRPKQVRFFREGVEIRPFLVEYEERDQRITELEARKAQYPQHFTPWEEEELVRLKKLGEEKEEIESFQREYWRWYQRDPTLEAFKEGDPELWDTLYYRIMGNLSRWVVGELPYNKETTLVPAFNLEARDSRGAFVVDFTKLDFGIALEGEAEFWQEVETEQKKRTLDQARLSRIEEVIRRVNEMREAGEGAAVFLEELNQFWSEWRNPAVDQSLGRISERWQALKQDTIPQGRKREAQLGRQLDALGKKIAAGIGDEESGEWWEEFLENNRKATPEELDSVRVNWAGTPEELEEAGLERSLVAELEEAGLDPSFLEEFDKLLAAQMAVRRLPGEINQSWELFTTALRNKENKDRPRHEAFTLWASVRDQVVAVIGDEELSDRWRRVFDWWTDEFHNLDSFDRSYQRAEELIRQGDVEAVDQVLEFVTEIEEELVGVFRTFHEIVEKVQGKRVAEARERRRERLEFALRGLLPDDFTSETLDQDLRRLSEAVLRRIERAVFLDRETFFVDLEASLQGIILGIVAPGERRETEGEIVDLAPQFSAQMRAGVQDQALSQPLLEAAKEIGSPRVVGPQTSTGFPLTAYFELCDNRNDRENTAKFLRVACSQLPPFEEIQKALRGPERIFDEVARFYPELYQEMVDNLYQAVSGPYFTTTLEPERRTATPRWVAERVEAAIQSGLLRAEYRKNMFEGARIRGKDWTSVTRLGLSRHERLQLLLHMGWVNTEVEIAGKPVRVTQRDLWEAFFRRAGLDITYEGLLAYVGWKIDGNGNLALDEDRKWARALGKKERLTPEMRQAIDLFLSHRFFQISFDHQVDFITDTLIDVFLGERLSEHIDFDKWLERFRTGKRWSPLFDPWDREKLFLSIRGEFCYGMGEEQGIQGKRIYDKLAWGKDEAGDIKWWVEERGLDRIRSLMMGTGALIPGNPEQIRPMYRYLSLPRFLYSEMATMYVSFYEQMAEELGIDWEKYKLYFWSMKPETVPLYMARAQEKLIRIAGPTFEVWRTIFGGSEKQAKDFMTKRNLLGAIDVREEVELAQAREKGIASAVSSLQSLALGAPGKALTVVGRLWSGLQDGKYRLGWGTLGYTLGALGTTLITEAPFAVRSVPGAAAAVAGLALYYLTRDLGDDPKGFFGGATGRINETLVEVPDRWVKKIKPDWLRRLVWGIKIPFGLRAERILRRRPYVIKEEWQWGPGGILPEGGFRDIFTPDSAFDDLLDQSWLEMFGRIAEEYNTYLNRGIEHFFEQLPYEIKPKEAPEFREKGRKWTRRQALGKIFMLGRGAAGLGLIYKLRPLLSVTGFEKTIQEVQDRTPEDMELNRLTYSSVDMLVDPVIFQEDVGGVRDYGSYYQKLPGGISNSANWEIIPEGKKRDFREVLEIYENLTRGVLTNEGRAEILSNVPVEQRSFRNKIEGVLTQLNDYQLKSGLQRLDEQALYGFLREHGYNQYQIDVWQAMVEAYRTNNGNRLAELLAEE